MTYTTMIKMFFYLLLFLSTAILQGHQILHSHPNNKPYSNQIEAAQFVESTLKNAIPLESDAEILHYASDQVTIEGMYIELGTGAARTTNFLAALNPKKKIYTFDSYLGHPAEWDKGGGKVLPKEFFAWPSDRELPALFHNVSLIKGWFVDTLPQFISEQNNPIAFLHVDCEIYESTAQALDILGPNMMDGTVILFDEFYNYPNYLSHEHKAFQEFLKKYLFEAEYLAYNQFHEQVVVRIHKVQNFNVE